MKKTTFGAYLLGLLALPLIGLAQDTILHKEPEGGYGICDILTLVNSIVNIGVKVIIPLIAVLIIAWAGFRMMANQGNSDVAKQTRTIFLAVAIGMVVMFASYAIVGVVLKSMNPNTDILNWAPTCTPE